MSAKTMYDSGLHAFKCFKNGSGMSPCWHEDMGPFNPDMTADEANKRSDHVGKITIEGQNLFKCGWRDAQDRHKTTP